MTHSITDRTDNGRAFNLMAGTWNADSIPSMEEAVDSLRVALEDAEVILSRLRDERLGLLDADAEYIDALDMQFDDEVDGERYGYWSEPDGPPDLDGREPPYRWEP